MGYLDGHLRPSHKLILFEISLEFGIKETSGKTQTIVLETSGTFFTARGI